MLVELKNMIGQYFKKKWLGTLTVVLLWLLSFSQSVLVSFTFGIMHASVLTMCLVVVFQVFRYFYPRIQKNKSNIINLIVALLPVMIIMAFIDLELSKIQVVKHYDLPVHFDFLFKLLFTTLPISISIIVSWAFLVSDKNRAHELHIEKLKTLNQEAELSELKNQLNPHFLFNALSNIYSIAYLGDKQTPDKIMQLSKMLRYVIYDTDVDFIELSKELNYLNYYIDFQRFKIEKDQNIEFNSDFCDQSLKIAPLLLLPFLENAFKHSQIATEKDAWIKMNIKTECKTIYFSVANTISKKAAPEILKNKGIGLDNIKKRLELIYGDSYSLNIDTNGTYRVNLIIRNNE